jgi:GNAT superfamily N-acetyltransferase
MRKKPIIQVVASRMGGFFGLHFFNLYYGEKVLLLNSGPNSLADYTHVRLANHEDLDNIIAITGMEIKERFERNLHLKSTCYVADFDGVIAGYSWTNRHVMSLLGMRLCCLSGNNIFLHDVFVFPEYRGKKIFQDMLYKVYDEMAHEGFLTISCFVDKDNSPSIAGFKRIGFKFKTAPILKLPGIRPFVIGGLPSISNRKGNRH